MVLPGIHMREDERDFSNRIEILDLIYAITSDCSKNCKLMGPRSRNICSVLMTCHMKSLPKPVKSKTGADTLKIIRSNIKVLRNGIIREELHRCMPAASQSQTDTGLYLSTRVTLKLFWSFKFITAYDSAQRITQVVSNWMNLPSFDGGQKDNFNWKWQTLQWFAAFEP